MMKRVLAAAILAALSGCAAPNGGGGGLLGTISTPYVRAKLSPAVVGAPVDALVGQMGAPDKSYTGADGTQTLSWSRVQQDQEFGAMSCVETVAARGGVVTNYSRRGRNC